MTDDELKAIDDWWNWLPNDAAPGMYSIPSDAEAASRAAADVPALIEEVRRLRTGLALAWSDGWQAAFDRPTDAEEAIKFRDLKHYRDVQAIIDGTTVD